MGGTILIAESIHWPITALTIATLSCTSSVVTVTTGLSARRLFAGFDYSDLADCAKNGNRVYKAATALLRRMLLRLSDYIA